MEELIQIIVLADDPLARAGLAALLATLPNCVVIAQNSSDWLFDAAAGAMEPAVDLIVWDGGWAISERDVDDPFDVNVPVLALVVNEEAAAVAWQLGSRGVLTREMNIERLAAAVSAVAAGLYVVAPSLVASIVRRDAAGDIPAIELTAREIEVLELLAEGLTNKAVAQRLSISDHTVKFHVNSILHKLDAQSRTDAVVRATRLGLIAL